MSDLEKVAALLHSIDRRDLDAMKPEQRKSLASALRRVADIADPPALTVAPKSGVLADLRSGAPRHE
jgi:hypothetical protein